MSKTLLLIAAGLTAALLLAHIFAGGALVVPPLLATQDMPAEAIWLAYFNWHAGSVSLALCAGALGITALRPRHIAAGIMAALILSGFALLGLAMAIFGNSALWGTPAPYAFAILAALAWTGLLTQQKPS